MNIRYREKESTSFYLNYQEEVQLLVTMPGINKKDTAAVIIAEIGVDMGQVSNLQTSCIMGRIVARKKHESAGRKKNTKTVKGNLILNLHCVRLAWAVSPRSRNQRLGIKYWSLAARRGKKKALVAIGHRMLNMSLSYASE